MKKSILPCLLKGPILLYRKVLSPLIGPSCRFYPTCSSYALEALDRHGAIKGMALAVKRFCPAIHGSVASFTIRCQRRLRGGALSGITALRPAKKGGRIIVAVCMKR